MIRMVILLIMVVRMVLIMMIIMAMTRVLMVMRVMNITCRWDPHFWLTCLNCILIMVMHNVLVCKGFFEVGFP